MCCSTGLCGAVVDAELANFAGLLADLARQAAQIERDNPEHEPLVFEQNTTGRVFPDEEGVSALPLIVDDRGVRWKGRHPNARERTSFAQAALVENVEGSIGCTQKKRAGH